METCQECGSIYIQYNPVREEIYCLIKNCMHREKAKFEDIKNKKINNPYLAVTIPNSEEDFGQRKLWGVLESIIYKSNTGIDPADFPRLSSKQKCAGLLKKRKTSQL